MDVDTHGSEHPNMEKGGLFRLIRVLVVLTVAIAVAVVLIAVRPRAQKRPLQETGHLVKTLSPEITMVTMPVEAYGTVSAKETVKLTAQVRGTVVQVDPAFTTGGAFSAGTLLLVIDARDYALEVARMAAQIRQYQAELDRIDQQAANLSKLLEITRENVSLAQTEYRRLNELADLNVSSATQRDQAHQQYLSGRERLQALVNEADMLPVARQKAMAALETAQVLRRKAQLDLERTRIVAPFDGRVIEKQVAVGEHVPVGGYLGTIYQKGALEVDVRVPLEDLAWLKDNSGGISQRSAEVRISGHPDAGRWPAKIVRIHAAVDSRTRTLPLVVAIDAASAAVSAEPPSSDNLTLLPGTFVTVRIQGRRIPDMVVLPRHVVHPGDVVYLAEGGRLAIRPVTVARRYREQVFVAAGLTPGDRVIRTPVVGAVAGLPIRTASSTATESSTPSSE